MRQYPWGIAAFVLDFSSNPFQKLSFGTKFALPLEGK